MTTQDMWDRLIEMGICEQTLSVVTAINGYKKETMTDILYAEFGLNSFDQAEGDE